ncbi:MAG: GGDEF domain-containing protein [Trueperaceae bacterium]|nr:GGDEF domain-containing protein [Trueperaceae bacterium]
MGRILPERTARPRTAPLAIAGAAVAIFVVAMSIVTLLTWASYRSLHDARIATLVARTDADLSFATSLLERTYAEIAGDVAVTAAAPSVQAAVAGDAATRAAGTTYLRRIVATYGRYARIRLVDADGREALHVVRNRGGARAVPPRTSPDLDRAARVAAAVAAPAGRLVLTDVATPDADAAHGDGAVVLVGFAMRLPPTPGVPPHVLSVEFDATPLVRRVFDVLRTQDLASDVIVVRPDVVMWAPPDHDAAWADPVPADGPHPLLSRFEGATPILTGDATSVRDADGLLVARTLDPTRAGNGRLHHPEGAPADRWTFVRHVTPATLTALAPMRDPSQRRILYAVAGVLALLSVALAATQERVRADRRRFRTDALHDALTGLGNRRAADDALARERARADRHATPLAVAALDLDHFKAINDRYGHPAGDAVLCAFAALAAEHLRDTDELFRVGGEEFLALLPATDARDAHAVLDRLRAVVAATPIDLPGDGTTPLTTSVGVAVLQPGAGAPGDLVAAADAALYDAKRAGRDRVVLAGG